MWFLKNWETLRINVSVFGIGAAIVYLAILPAVLRYTASDSPFRRIIRSSTSVVPALLLLAQGLIWVLAFKRQSWIHYYWQYFMAPFFAVAMAVVVLATFTFLTKLAPRAAKWVVFLLMILPMPFFASSLDTLHQYQTILGIIPTFKKLAELVPPRVPVMSSERYPQLSNTVGSYTSYWILPHFAYYAKWPLIYSTDINEILANRQGCAAYVMQLTKDPNCIEVARLLNERYKLAWNQENYLIFLLNQKPNHN
jgi:hypothetical protein